MESHLCDVCTKMFNAIMESALPKENQDMLCEGAYHSSIADIHAAAAESCGICVKVDDCIVERQPNERLEEKAQAGTFRVEVWRRYRSDPTSKRSNDSAYIVITMKCPGAWFDFKAVQHSPMISGVFVEDKDSFRMTCYQMPSSGGFPASILASAGENHEISDTTGVGHTGGPITLDLAKRWLEACVKAHPSCARIDGEHFLPPRLLCLRNSAVHLMETSSMKPVIHGYTALSHCWGTSSLTLKLTASNKNSLCGNIPEDILPRTFKDAVAISRALGFDWLWIDSLCILQSDTNDVGDKQHIDDWLCHVAIMDQIYQNSTLNIAAAASVDTETGCFQRRSNGVQYQPCILAVPNFRSAARNGHRIPVEKCLVASPRFAARGAEFSFQNLDYRGWVAQERLLSRRTIHWANDQIFWECSEVSLATEALPIGIETGRISGHHPPYNWKSENVDAQHSLWLRILQAYTRRRLTRSEDILPAIAGVARKTNSVLSDIYIAGHFKSHLPSSLLWTTRSHGYATSVTHPYRAPSWSWASVESTIHWDYEERSDLIIASTIEKAHIELVQSLNPFGQVSSGFLEVCGPVSTLANITRTERSIKASPINFKSPSVHLDIDTFPDWFERKRWIDPYGTFDWSCVILLLVLRSMSGSEDSSVEIGLVLAPSHYKGAAKEIVSASKMYIRIGTFSGEGFRPEFEGYSDMDVGIE